MLQMFSHQRGLSSGEPAVGESSVTSSSSILPTTDDLDEVLADSEHFIEELRASLPLERSMYFSPFKYVMSKISSSDSSNEKLASVYRSLLPKIDGVEAVLRTKVIELIQKKQVLQEQGRFLKTRLDSCIIFNGDTVNSNDHFIDELRDFVGRLSKECTVVNDILMFNTELIRQNLIQAANHKKGCRSTYTSWSYQIRLLTPKELESDPHHAVISDHLKRLKKCKTAVMEHLASALVSREQHGANLETTVDARSKLVGILRRGRRSEGNSVCDTPENDSNADENAREGTLERVYDHHNCHDCSCGSDLALDCHEHFEILSVQGIKMTQRLSSLVELREKIIDLWGQSGDKPSVS